MRFSGITLLLIVTVSLAYLGCSKDEVDNDAESLIQWVSCSGNGVDSTIYYVSPSGDDAAAGTDSNQTLKTIYRALQKVKPGGTVRILPGTYEECIGISGCGTSTYPITIVGYHGTPVLDGKNEKPLGIFCEGCNNFIFRNLKIRNYTDMGISASQSKDMVFRELEVSDNGHAVQLKDWELEGYGIHVEESENVEINDNDVFGNGPDPQIFPDYIMGTGIDTYGNSNVLIKGNRSHHNTGGGILVEDSHNVVVEDNEIFNNDLDASTDGWWDGGLWLDGGGDVTVRSNHFHDNLGPGIEISDEDGQHPTGYVLENNTSTGNYYGIFLWNFGTASWPSPNILSRSGNQFTGNSMQDVWIEDHY